jgi:hypothetical protein
MALVQNQVSLLVGANGFALWHYRTPDAKAAIHAANYFNPISSQLNVGDFIAYNAVDATEMASVVSISLAGVVVISAGTAVLATSEELKKAADAKAKAEAEAKITPPNLGPGQPPPPASQPHPTAPLPPKQTPR